MPIRDLPTLAERLRQATVLRYGLASAGALAVDTGLFLALIALGLGAAAASAVGYCAGIVAHWLLSSRAVFIAGLAERGAARAVQKGLFVASALIGLGVTIGIVGLVTALHGDARIGKLLAIVASFTLTWLLRRHLVFRVP